MQRSTVLAALALLTACAVVLWPGPFAPGLIGHPTGDLAYHVWGTDWFGGELLQGRLPLYTRVTHLPDGGWLYHPDPLGALLALAKTADAERWAGWKAAGDAALAQRKP